MSDGGGAMGFRRRLWILLALLIGASWFFVLPTGAQRERPMMPLDFTLAAPQGLDPDYENGRQNSWAWSMQWWQGHLYVGTSRAWGCASRASLNFTLPGTFPYPPDDPDLLCTPDPQDLPLQAEIWRWGPSTKADQTSGGGAWELVYRAPADLPIPGTTKFVARDIGYRGMSVYEEPDGTEALYVSGVAAVGLDYYGVLAPPRILRSTDGSTFNPLPQEPGTFLGDFPFGSFRGSTSYKGNFYIVGATLHGSGYLIEAFDPTGGNDAFHWVGPPNDTVVEAAVFNGHLYIGTEDFFGGYSVFKTDATGDPPYVWTQIVDDGGYLPDQPNAAVVSMQVFGDHLYVGSDSANLCDSTTASAELIRIDSDDSWDLIIGTPRDTPAGPKEPLSGITSGFGNPYNEHIWRMAEFGGELYVGTYDCSTTLKDDPDIPPEVRENMGFDLYRSPDGVNFHPVTTNGFDDPATPEHEGMFDTGVRSMAATPHGLFFGTANQYYGLRIWRSSHSLFLPLLHR